MQMYDFVIAGAGAAGLSLAHRLIHSPLQDASILIVDRDAKRSNDRTWCFWTSRDMHFDPVVSHQWYQLRFTGKQFDKVYDIRPYAYKMVRGIDFYDYTRADLLKRPNVTWLQGSVESITDGSDCARVRVDGKDFYGKWVFDSTFNPAEFHPNPARYHNLMQHFLGWEIETSAASFDPGVVTLFDFRTPQKDSMRFMYVLPFSPHKALVEYTLFSAQLLDTAEYEHELRAYIQDVLTIPAYSIASVERGIIPMTDMPFPRRAGSHILNIGTRGGRVKPSTGYSFLRSQHDTEAIVQSLVATGQPFRIPADRWPYHYLDSIMLNLMFRRGGEMKSIFTSLFKNNPIHRLFRFLDEETSALELLQVLASVPPWPFLKAWFRLKVLRKV